MLAIFLGFSDGFTHLRCGSNFGSADFKDEVVLDAGCGDGFYLGTLAHQIHCAAHGVDISIPAVDAAARRYPACEWIVANVTKTTGVVLRS